MYIPPGCDRRKRRRELHQYAQQRRSQAAQKKRKSHVTQRRTRSQISNLLGIAFSRILYLKHTNVFAFDSPKNVRSAVRFREEARPSLPRMKAWGNEEYRVISFKIKIWYILIQKQKKAMGTTEQFGRYGNTTLIMSSTATLPNSNEENRRGIRFAFELGGVCLNFQTSRKTPDFPKQKTLWYHFRLFHNYLAERPGTRPPLPVHDVDPVRVGGGGLAGQLGLWKKIKRK